MQGGWQVPFGLFHALGVLYDGWRQWSDGDKSREDWEKRVG
jgi:hypothetical protein